MAMLACPSCLLLKSGHELVQRRYRNTAQAAGSHRAQRTRSHQLINLGSADSQHARSVLGTHEQNRKLVLGRLCSHAAVPATG